MLASRRHGVLYTGSTTHLVRRIHQHRENLLGGFTAKYGVTRLVWWEAHARIAMAALRERRIKRWRRAWKINLIEEKNPQWLDLWERLLAASV